MLNEKQQHAVDCNDRFIFLYAGAGTGKTTVMIKRIQRLISSGIPPKEILGLTFTNKAALHMNAKLGNESVTLQTFHAWAYACVNKTIIPNEVPFSQVYLKAVSDFKNAHMTNNLPYRFRKYQVFMSSHSYIDYDDLLIEAIISNGFNKTYTHILIDEFQDTNPIQLKVLETLIKSETHVFAVGDPDQSIYKFRGAMPFIVELYIKTLQATSLTLDINYRSDVAIINHANQVLTYNKKRYKKTLLASTSNKGDIYIINASDTFFEARKIFEMILDFPLKSILITARTHERLYEIKYYLFYLYESYNKNRIHVFTIHQAKGLEFDVVFVCGLEQGVLPLGKYLNIDALEEERRLFYVAITRAKHTLILSYVETYQQKKWKPSHFLQEFMVRTNKKV